MYKTNLFALAIRKCNHAEFPILVMFLELQNQIEILEQGQQTGQDNNSLNSSEKIRELEKTVRNLKREKEEALKVVSSIFEHE